MLANVAMPSSFSPSGLLSFVESMEEEKEAEEEEGARSGVVVSLSLSPPLSSVEANGESTEKEGGGREGLFYISLRGGGKAVCAKKLEWKRGKTPFLFQSPFLSVVCSAVCFW